MNETGRSRSWLQRQYPGFRWRYVPPNLVTTISLGLGLLCLVEVARGGAENLADAAWLILWCGLLDKADGFVARRLDAVSDFGAQLDSFADLVSFGVCPAALTCGVWLAGQDPAAPPGLLETTLVLGGCLVYLAGAALRLVRFTLHSASFGDEYFFGLATTLCGALVASYYLTVAAHATDPRWLDALPAGLAVLGVLMISNVPLPKLQRRDARWLDVFQGCNVAGAYVCGALRLLPEYLLGLVLLYLGVGVPWALAHGARRPGARDTGAEDTGAEESLSRTDRTE